ncbi:MAG: single-stranded DNA-binding protein [Bacteroidia bacterium]|nr:single-stranded DNA-binding protein [Bacteroidia bacterium]
MNSFRNRVILSGHLGQDPETKHFDSGKSFAKFSLATNETYKNDKGENVTETQWHNLVAWNGLAKTAEKLLGKGKEVVVEGKLVTRSYTDKEGAKRYITEVVVSELLLIAPRNKEKDEMAF